MEAVTRETKASLSFGVFQITFTFGIPNYQHDNET